MWDCIRYCLLYVLPALTSQRQVRINTLFSSSLLSLSKYHELQIGFRRCQSQGQLVSVTCELNTSVHRYFSLRETIRCGRIINMMRLIASISGCSVSFLSNFRVVARFVLVQSVTVSPSFRLTNCTSVV